MGLVNSVPQDPHLKILYFSIFLIGMDSPLQIRHFFDLIGFILNHLTAIASQNLNCCSKSDFLAVRGSPETADGVGRVGNFRNKKFCHNFSRYPVVQIVPPQYRLRKEREICICISILLACCTPPSGRTRSGAKRIPRWHPARCSQ